MPNNQKNVINSEENSLRKRIGQNDEWNEESESVIEEGKLKEAARKLYIKNTAHEHLTTLAHACVVVFTLYIVYKCFTAQWEVFTLHPLFYAVGWIFIMTEAVLLFSKDNVFTSNIGKVKRVQYHWILQTSGVLLSTVAFLTTYLTAEDNTHFRSWHGLFGITSMIICYVSLINGTAVFYWAPRINKMFHTITGFLTVVLGMFTVLLSLYSRWFNKSVENNKDIVFICSVVVFCGLFWSLVIPGSEQHLLQLIISIVLTAMLIHYCI